MGEYLKYPNRKTKNRWKKIYMGLLGVWKDELILSNSLSNKNRFNSYLESRW